MNYKENDVLKRVNEHFEYLVQQGYEVVFVAHQGSWNYELGYEGSDVDTKAIILPSFDDFCDNKEPVSKTIVLENNEHIDVKDIRIMFENFKKQNINFLEILFSKYRIINFKYIKLIQPLFENRELIAHFNINQALRCMAGMSMEKKKAMCHPYPSLIDKIEKYGYDNKQLHHILRMNDFIKRYANGESFESCLIPTDKKYLLEIKRTFMPLEKAILLADKTDTDTKFIKDKNLTENDEINEESIKILNSVKSNILRKRFKEELI